MLSDGEEILQIGCSDLESAGSYGKHSPSLDAAFAAKGRHGLHDE